MPAELPAFVAVAAVTVMTPGQDTVLTIRSGRPRDPDADLALPVWAGVLPLRIVPGIPQADPHLRSEAEVPPYVTDYTRDRGRSSDSP